MRVDRDDARMLYRIIVDVYEDMRLVRSFMIPTSVIVNTFTEIARLAHNGYRDNNKHMKTMTIRDEKKDMR